MEKKTDEIQRLRRSGYTALEIAKLFECTRQYVYVVLRRAPKLKASITATDTGFHITTEDNNAAGTAIQRALSDSGWEVVVDGLGMPSTKSSGNSSIEARAIAAYLLAAESSANSALTRADQGDSSSSEPRIEAESQHTVSIRVGRQWRTVT